MSEACHIAPHHRMIKTPFGKLFALSERRASSEERGMRREGAGCRGGGGGGGSEEEEEWRELEAGLIPHCHYPHFLATVCELAS